MRGSPVSRTGAGAKGVQLRGLRVRSTPYERGDRSVRDEYVERLRAINEQQDVFGGGNGSKRITKTIGGLTFTWDEQ
jgi:hypothetical protein